MTAAALPSLQRQRRLSRLALEDLALAESSESLAAIGGMLRWSRPLGFVDEERVRRAIRGNPEAAPARAREIARRIQQGQRFTVWEVVGWIEEGQEI